MKLTLSALIALAASPHFGKHQTEKASGSSGHALERIWALLERDDAARLVVSSGQDRWSDSLERRLAGLANPFQPRR